MPFPLLFHLVISSLLIPKDVFLSLYNEPLQIYHVQLYNLEMSYLFLLVFYLLSHKSIMLYYVKRFLNNPFLYQQFHHLNLLLTLYDNFQNLGSLKFCFLTYIVIIIINKLHIHPNIVIFLFIKSELFVKYCSSISISASDYQQSPAICFKYIYLL